MRNKGKKSKASRSKVENPTSQPDGAGLDPTGPTESASNVKRDETVLLTKPKKTKEKTERSRPTMSFSKSTVASRNKLVKRRSASNVLERTSKVVKRSWENENTLFGQRKREGQSEPRKWKQSSEPNLTGQNNEEQTLQKSRNLKDKPGEGKDLTIRCKSATPWTSGQYKQDPAKVVKPPRWSPIKQVAIRSVTKKKDVHSKSSKVTDNGGRVTLDEVLQIKKTNSNSIPPPDEKEVQKKPEVHFEPCDDGSRTVAQGGVRLEGSKVCETSERGVVNPEQSLKSKNQMPNNSAVQNGAKDSKCDDAYYSSVPVVSILENSSESEKQNSYSEYFTTTPESGDNEEDVKTGGNENDRDVNQEIQISNQDRCGAEGSKCCSFYSEDKIGEDSKIESDSKKIVEFLKDENCAEQVCQDRDDNPDVCHRKSMCPASDSCAGNDHVEAGQCKSNTISPTVKSEKVSDEVGGHFDTGSPEGAKKDLGQNSIKVQNKGISESNVEESRQGFRCAGPTNGCERLEVDDRLTMLVEYQSMLAKNIKALLTDLDKMVSTSASSSGPSVNRPEQQRALSERDRCAVRDRSRKVHEIIDEFETKCQRMSGKDKTAIRSNENKSPQRQSVVGSSGKTAEEEFQNSAAEMCFEQGEKGACSERKNTLTSNDAIPKQIVHRKDEIFPSPQSHWCGFLEQNAPFLRLQELHSVFVQAGTPIGARKGFGKAFETPKMAMRLANLLDEMNMWKTRLEECYTPGFNLHRKTRLEECYTPGFNLHPYSRGTDRKRRRLRLKEATSHPVSRPNESLLSIVPNTACKQTEISDEMSPDFNWKQHYSTSVSMKRRVTDIQTKNGGNGDCKTISGVRITAAATTAVDNDGAPEAVASADLCSDKSVKHTEETKVVGPSSLRSQCALLSLSLFIQFFVQYLIEYYKEV